MGIHRLMSELRNVLQIIIWGMSYKIWSVECITKRKLGSQDTPLIAIAHPLQCIDGFVMIYQFTGRCCWVLLENTEIWRQGLITLEPFFLWNILAVLTQNMMMNVSDNSFNLHFANLLTLYWTGDDELGIWCWCNGMLATTPSIYTSLIFWHFIELEMMN